MTSPELLGALRTHSEEGGRYGGIPRPARSAGTHPAARDSLCVTLDSGWAAAIRKRKAERRRPRPAEDDE
jgi:hypothetical protein